MKFIILRNLAINPTKLFTARQISKFLEPYGSIGGSLSSGSVGSMLRVYVARGTIKAISSPSGPTEYQIASRVVNSSTPLGKYV